MQVLLLDISLLRLKSKMSYVSKAVFVIKVWPRFGERIFPERRRPLSFAALAEAATSGRISVSFEARSLRLTVA
jgi:hypothetical protein